MVTIETECGLSGYGVGGGGISGMHVVRSVLKQRLRGTHFDAAEELWDDLDTALLPVGSNGLASMALSAVDLALWDLQGKANDAPVAKLLNPNVDLDQPIPTYLTVWDEIPESVLDSPAGVKLHLGHFEDGNETDASVDHFVQRTATARKVIGDDRPLMVDAWMTWDVATTLEYADRVKDLNLEWIEEPLPLTDLEGYQTLSRECSIPIAGGEHLFSLREFKSVIDDNLHQTLQPDINWMGGLTPMIKLIEMAKSAGVRVVPHRGGELWGLHAVAGLLDDPLAESGRPWMSWVGGQPEIKTGTIKIPDRPGLGVSVDVSFPDAERVISLD